MLTSRLLSYGELFTHRYFLQIKIDDEMGLRFNTQTCEALVCVTYDPPTEFIVGPTGGNYISEDVGKVEISVPPDCFDHETTLRVKVNKTKISWSKQMVKIFLD